MPKYSFVVPTRQRHDTLFFCLKNLLQQQYDDYEIIVQDNASDHRTYDTVKSFESDKIKYDRSDVSLSMNDNWEQGVRRSKGEYISVIGDDDGMMLYACRVADMCMSIRPFEVMFWKPHSYWWSNCVVKQNRDMLFVRVPPKKLQVFAIDSKKYLEKAFRLELSFLDVPSIYYGFVHRDIFAKIGERTGGRWFPDPIVDVFNGASNLFLSENIIMSHVPLCVRGTSGHSGGVAMVHKTAESEHARTAYMQDVHNPRDRAGVHPDLVYPRVGPVWLATALLNARDLFAPDRTDLKIPIPVLLAQMKACLNTAWSNYYEVIEDMAMIAEKHSIDMSNVNVPAPVSVDQLPRTAPGVYASGNNVADAIGIDCKMAGVFDIEAAVRMCHAVTHPF